TEVTTRRMRLLLLILMAALLTCKAYGLGGQAPFANGIEVSGFPGHLTLGDRLVYLSDPEGKLSIADILDRGENHPWQRSTKTIPDLGLNPGPHWLAFNLTNASPEDVDALLEMS